MKAKTYQAVKDALYEWIQWYEKYVSEMSEEDINEEYEIDGIHYTIWETKGFERIYKPVYMSIEKITIWFNEFGYDIKFNGKFTLIPIERKTSKGV